MSHIGAHVHILREDRQWSQKDLAEKSDLSSSYISDIEAGRRNPTVESLEKIAKALRISLAELMAIKRFNLTPSEGVLIALIRKGKYAEAHTLLNKIEANHA